MTQVNSSMNFLPEDYVEKRQAARTAVIFIGLLMLVVGGVVGTYLYKQWTMNVLRAERDQMNTAFEEASKQIAQAQEMEKQKEEMVRKAEITTTLMERVKRSALLGELTKLGPQGVSFVSLDLKAKEIPPVPGAHPNADMDKLREMQGDKVEVPKPPAMDVTLTLMGTAPTDSDVAAYMAALQKSPILTGIALLFSEEYKKDKDAPAIRKFSVELHVNPDADLRAGFMANAEK